MLFSIVIPIYNSKYLTECLKSIENQTYTDFEVILVNDGSTDFSVEVCKKYQYQHRRNVTLINQDNLGQIAARVNGYKAAKGKYVVSLDSDDCLAPCFLEEVAKTIKKYKCDIVAFGYSENPLFLDYHSLPFEDGRVYRAEEIKRLFATSNILNNMWSKVVLRECLRDQDKCLKYSKYRMGEDAIQSACIYSNADNLIYIGKPIYFYRQSSNSIMHNPEISHLYSLIDVDKLLLNTIETWANDDPSGICVGKYYDRVISEVFHILLLCLRNKDYRQIKVILSDIALRLSFIKLSSNISFINIIKYYIIKFQFGRFLSVLTGLREKRRLS